MSDQTQPAMTMREIRQALGYNLPPDGLPDPVVQPTSYSVNCLPEGGLDSHAFAITVEYRGEGRWAVTRHGSCLGADGKWDFGVNPHDRGDDWLAAHRFDEATALKLAKEYAPHVAVNGYTVADALRMAAADAAPQSGGAL